MTGRDFMACAEQFAEGLTEAVLRSAVSRAYYGAFHQALALLHACGVWLPKTEQVHVKVGYCLNKLFRPHSGPGVTGGSLNSIIRSCRWKSNDRLISRPSGKAGPQPRLGGRISVMARLPACSVLLSRFLLLAFRVLCAEEILLELLFPFAAGQEFIKQIAHLLDILRLGRVFASNVNRNHQRPTCGELPQVVLKIIPIGLVVIIFYRLFVLFSQFGVFDFAGRNP